MNMKNLLLFAALISTALTNAQTYDWAFSLGGTNDDFGNSIATDASGNVYVTGSFRNTTDFDPGAGTANLTSAGANDIFLAKYDATGNYQWAFGVGSIDFELGKSIAIDASGNVYITGQLMNTADFDPSGNTSNLTANGQYDMFVAKYDASGNYMWAFNVGDIGVVDGNSIVTDAAGNVYLTGMFTTTPDFDPSGNTATITSSNFGIFFAKYDTGGNYILAKSITGINGEDIGNSIATDNTGNMYITGSFEDIVDFDPGAGVANLTAPGDIHIP